MRGETQHLIELVAALDGILKMQAAADTDYLLRVCRRALDAAQVQRLRDTMLKAYRWQYIVSGAQHPRFAKLLISMLTAAQAKRVCDALAPIVG